MTLKELWALIPESDVTVFGLETGENVRYLIWVDPNDTSMANADRLPQALRDAGVKAVVVMSEGVPQMFKMETT